MIELICCSICCSICVIMLSWVYFYLYQEIKALKKNLTAIDERFKSISEWQASQEDINKHTLTYLCTLQLFNDKWGCTSRGRPKIY